MTSPATMRLMGLLAIVGIVAGCGDRRLPEEVSAWMDKTVEAASRAERLQYEMTERILVSGLSGDEPMDYEARLHVAKAEAMAALEEMCDAAERHDLNFSILVDEFLARCAPHTRRLRRQYPKAAEAIEPPKALRRYP